MKNTIITLAFISFTLTNINAQKISITTNSEKALDIYKKGWLLEDKLELDEAEKMYHKAINIDSTFALAYMRLAMVKDNYDVRKVQLRNAINHINEVTEGEKLWILARFVFYIPEEDESKEYGYFKKLVELYPNDEMANYLFAYVNLHHGVLKPELAIHHFEKAIELNPNFIKPYNELIYAYIENQDYINAKKVAQTQTQLLPNSVNPLDTYAEIFLRSGEYEKSVSLYRKVLDINSTFPWALMGIATNLNFLNRHYEARVFLSKIDESRLSDYEYRHKWRAYITSYLDEGNFEEAINTLEDQKQETITGKNQREQTFHIYYTFLRKTRLFFENNQAEKALSEYNSWKNHTNEFIDNERTKQLVNNLEMYYNAFHSFSSKDYDKAIEQLNSFKDIIKRETDSYRVLLSRIFLETKQYQKAISILSEANLDNPYNQYWIMIAYQKVGDKEKAKKYKEKILNLNERNNINLSLVRRKTLDFEI